MSEFNQQEQNNSAHFVKKNLKQITAFLVILVLIVGGYFGYLELYQKPREIKAADAMFAAENYFAQDSSKLVLNGNGTNKGVLYIIKNYSGTKAANLAKYYADADPFWLNMGNGYGKCLDPAGVTGPCNPKYWESVLRNPGNSLEGMKEFAMWLPIIKDSAAAAPTAWYFRNEGGNIGSQCVDSQSQITGLVTTNATVFIPGPPSFNESEGSLDYKVLAPHLLADGTVSIKSADGSVNDFVINGGFISVSKDRVSILGESVS